MKEMIGKVLNSFWFYLTIGISSLFVGIFMLWVFNDFKSFILCFVLCLAAIFVSYLAETLSSLVKENFKEKKEDKSMIVPIDPFDRDYPDSEITEETRQITMQTARSGRFSHVPVRIALGMFWTDEEWKEYRDKVLKTPLP